LVFYNIHNSKNTYLPPISKKDGLRDKGIRIVHFSIIICYKITLLVSEKKKSCLWGCFGICTWVFCVIKLTMGRFGIFMFYFLIEKLLARVPHAPASGWHSHHLGGACDAARGQI
jgi:hypothetical protein